MTFYEWKQRSKAYRKTMNCAPDDIAAKRIESLCRAAFTAGVGWGLETYEAKVDARMAAMKAPPNDRVQAGEASPATAGSAQKGL